MTQTSQSSQAKKKGFSQKPPKEEKLIVMELQLAEIPSPRECEKTLKEYKYFAWGQDNLYPQWLNWLFQNNSLHGGIINAKVNYLVSGGLEYKAVDVDDQIAYDRMLANGTSDFDLNEICEQIALDYELSNKFVLKGKWSMDFSYVEKLELLDYEMVRKEVDSDNIIYCEDFTDTLANVKCYVPLNLKLKGSKRQEGVKRNRFFYISFEQRSKQFKEKDSKKINTGKYPAPPYVGGLRPINTGVEIDTFQGAEIENNFAVGTIVNMNNGLPRNKEDKEATEKKVKGTGTGAKNAGKIFVSFNNGKDREATIASMTGSDLPDRYKLVDEGIENKTFYAHSVTSPELFGAKTPGSLGNSDLETSYLIMDRNYFRKRRNNILSVLNYIGQKCNGLRAQMTFKKVPLIEVDETNIIGAKLTKLNPVITAQVMAEMTSNEKRSLAGLPALEGGDIIKPEATFKGSAETDKRLISALTKCGIDKKDKTIFYSIPLSKDSKGADREALEKFLKEEFAEIKEKDLQILNLLKEENDVKSIAKALDSTPRAVQKVVDNLIDEGYLTEEMKVTSKGAKAIAASDIEQLQIMYSYEKRKEISGPELLDTSRELCVALVELNRLYTREEIDIISANEGYDVFAYKGGWYHNPNTGKTTPFCRHSWFQNVVFKN